MLNAVVMVSDIFLVLRTPSGLSGDMLVAGLAALLGLDTDGLAARIDALHLPAFKGCVRLEQRIVKSITGCHLRIDLPHEHVHRGLNEISSIIEGSDLLPEARSVALSAFERLAEVEAEMHGLTPEEVHFHEIGALDSILDVCMAAQLHAEMGSPQVVCSPLPLGDGSIRCQHGLLSAPAPAVLRMLEGVPVYGVGAVGETVTPTALAVLRALPCFFGDWPAMTVDRTARAYGTRVFDNLPNGAIFALGRPSDCRQSYIGPKASVLEHAHADDHMHD